jgi:hypothetical protein
MSAHDGFRRVVSVGNAQYRTNFFLTGLVGGQTYYWSVQAIDNGYAGSAFASEMIFHYGSRPPFIMASSGFFVLEDAPAEMVVELSDPDSPLQALSLAVILEDPIAIPASSVAITGRDNYRVVSMVPASNFSGVTRLILIATDEMGASSTNTVIINVVPVNDQPVARPISASTLEDSTASIHLSGEDVDGDDLSFRVTALPLHGILSGSPPNLYYTPEKDYFGTDRCFFVADDGLLDSRPVEVEITVQPVPDVSSDQLQLWRRADGLIEIRLEGEPRQLYWLETGVDLAHWTEIVLLDSGLGEIRVVDDPSQPMRFYRLRRAPP